MNPNFILIFYKQNYSPNDVFDKKNSYFFILDIYLFFNKLSIIHFSLSRFLVIETIDLLTSFILKSYS